MTDSYHSAGVGNIEEKYEQVSPIRSYNQATSM